MPRPPIFTDTGTYNGDSVTLASGTVTASGTSGVTGVGEWNTLRLYCAVTAVSGTTPSMTVTVQHSADASTWRTLGTFAAKTSVTSERLVLSALDRYVRCSWAVTGTTPSFTFSVAGEAL